MKHLFLIFICIRGLQYQVDLGFDKYTNTYHAMKLKPMFLHCDASNAKKIDLKGCFDE